MSASDYALGQKQEAFTLNALPTAEQLRQMWSVLADAGEFGLDEIFVAAMDAAHAAHVPDEDVAFDRPQGDCPEEDRHRDDPARMVPRVGRGRRR